jgi:hypothetical protein
VCESYFLFLFYILRKLLKITLQMCVSQSWNVLSFTVLDLTYEVTSCVLFEDNVYNIELHVSHVFKL